MEWKREIGGSTIHSAPLPSIGQKRMPTYEYVCKQCDETFEIFQSFSDKPLKKHEDCGGALQKVFHSRGIVFKGSGFYATDSKSSASSKTPKSGDKDSKPAKKTDTKTTEKAPASAKKD